MLVKGATVVSNWATSFLHYPIHVILWTFEYSNSHNFVALIPYQHIRVQIRTSRCICHVSLILIQILGIKPWLHCIFSVIADLVSNAGFNTIVFAWYEMCCFIVTHPAETPFYCCLTRPVLGKVSNLSQWSLPSYRPFHLVPPYNLI